MSTAEPGPDPEQIAADAAARADDPGATTRQWLLETHTATLCTTSVHREVAGIPFGSVVPFALDARGRPFILIASIAAHTANLRQSPLGSLFVRQPELAGDPQAGWRITVMGTWEPVDRDDPGWPELHARYRARVPAAASHMRTHGFDYWRMSDVRKVRYIAGFGKICWLAGSEIDRDPGGAGVSDAAPGAVAHMNDDHAANLVEMCRGLHGIEPARCEMVGLHRDGFLVRTEGPSDLLFFPFGREIGAGDIRHAVIEVLTQARRSQDPR